NESTATRFSADLIGSAYGWDVTASVGATKVKNDLDYSGYVNRSALYAALRNGTFNVLGGNSPAVMNQ
ncbi:hypothetical protein LTR94_038468, partial [Friedmanniomyces endolithicus]